MAVFKCKMCGGSLDVTDNMSVAKCPYCGETQTLPRLDSDKKANLYDRANHFRRNNDYDKAMSIYESILNEDGSDAEAYWSLVLCKYGIEYVEDPLSHKRMPTVNRTQFTSIFSDEDYKSAINYSDVYQRKIYEAEAKAIDEIQKSILEISEKEDPFDVFICYKETDNQGRRTPDSVLATELYHELSKEGFKVFFSRITLEDKLGTAYEPYIFAALNSSKVMVVLGTKPEYFNAVWVKNEWSRYLSLTKSGAKKTLVPAYRDMDPYDLPEEFSHLQALDMSKLGFMQDLIRGINKIIKSQTFPTVKEAVTIENIGTVSADSLVKRCYLFLEDKDWSKAEEYVERILDLDPYNHEAYFVKVLIDFRCSSVDELKNTPIDLYINKNFERALKFSNGEKHNYYESIMADIRLNEKLKKQLEEKEKTDEEQKLIDRFVTEINICIKNIPNDNETRIEKKKYFEYVKSQISQFKYIKVDHEVFENLYYLIAKLNERILPPGRIRCNHCGREQSESIKRCLYCGKLIDFE